MTIEAYAQGPDYVVEHGANITLYFSKLLERSDGYTAITRIEVQGYPGYADGRVYNSRIGFTSPTSKNQAIKDAASIIPEIPWRTVIEQSIDAVGKLIENGDPLVWLDEGEATLEDKPYAVESLVRLGEPTLFYGLGGVGKSNLALGLAASLATGEALLGFHALKTKMLVVDYEDDAASWKHRLQSLTTGVLGARPRIAYKPAAASLVSLYDGLARQIHDEHIEGLVLDSVAMACGGDPEKAEYAMSFFRTLRALKLKVVILVGHHTKADDKWPFGSVFWWNQTRSIWLVKSPEEETNPKEIGLLHRKSNNGPKQAPVGLTMQFAPDKLTISRSDFRHIVDLRSELHLRPLIETIVADRPGLSKDELWEECKAAHTSLTKNTWRVTLFRLLKTKLTETRGGIWLLATEQSS